MERLMALKQVGSVADYLDRFEMLSAPVWGMPNAFDKGVFLNGLREDVLAEVKMHKASTLQEVMEMVQQIGDRNEAVGRMGRWKNGRVGGLGWSYSFSEVPSGRASTLGSSLRPNSGRGGEEVRRGRPVVAGAIGPPRGGTSGYQRMSEEEVQQCQARGLCFKCDQKYSPSHRCKNRQQLQMLLAMEDESEGDGEAKEEEASKDETL